MGDETTNIDMAAERERRILEMWPRFKDGEPVLLGDVVAGPLGNTTAVAIEFTAECVNIKDGANSDWNSSISKNGRLKRPAPEVLDADGVPIKVGDKVWHESGHASGVVTSIDALSLMHTTRYVDEGGTEFRDAARNLTHTRPDSWERLEEDAAKLTCDYFGVECDSEERCRACPHFQEGLDCSLEMNADIVRRAKKLAGVE